MKETELIFALATLLGALGMWLLLPRGSARGRWLGALLGLAALGLLGSQLPVIRNWAQTSAFFVLAGATVVAAAATVTSYNPVYSAIWFAFSLLGTAGLFLFQGAQFLGVATIVVYAGAILVTFLFVLMLANPQGHAFYDRLSWEGQLAAATGAVLVGILTLTVASLELQAPTSTPVEQQEDILSTAHMAHLGGHLFSEHLVSVEIAGTLLLVALVGAIAIVSQIKVGSSRTTSVPPDAQRRSPSPQEPTR